MCTPIPRCPITPLTIESAELSSLFYFLSCFWLLSWSEDQIPTSHMSILSVCRISQWVMQEVHAWVFPALTPDLLWTSTLASHVTSRASISAVMTNTNQVRPWDPEDFLHKCASRIDFQWLLLAPNFIQLCVLCHLSGDKMRERNIRSKSDGIKDWNTVKNPVPKLKIWHATKIHFSVSI